MDHGDQPDDLCEGLGLEGTLAEEVPDLAVCEARYHGAIQTDDFWYGLVFYLAALYDVYVYRRLRPYCRYPYGLTDTAATFQTNAGLFGKVYFPRLVTPVSKVISKLFRFSLQLSTFVFVYLYFVIRGVDLHPNIYLLLFPVLILMMQCMALGLGLIVSSLTTKYRDLTNFFGVFVSLWMYATPIVYPLSYVTNPTLHKIMLFNPMTAIIETFKYGAFGAGQFSWSSLGFSAACIAILLFVGIAMFNRKQKYFIDTI